MRIEYCKIQDTDAKEFLIYLNQVSKETDFTGFDSSQFSIDEETEKNKIKEIKFDNYTWTMIAKDGKKIIGDCSLKLKNTNFYKHRANFGVSVLKEYWSKGIGSNLLNLAIREARSRDISVIELEVIIDNDRAINLYKKFGFEIIGTYKKYLRIEKQFYDVYLMNLYL